MIMSFPEYYEAARQHLISGQPTVAGGLLSGGLHFDNLARVGAQRSLTALDIRCDYLQQLTVVATQGNLSPKLIQQAYNSAYTTPVKVTAGQLLGAAKDELAQMLADTQRVTSLLGNGLLTDYGLLNTVAIKLQDPNATNLLTYQQINKLGLAVQRGSSPIFVFVPTQQSYFQRNGNPVNTLEATPAEQLKIMSGDIEVTSSVQYRINQYYDIGRLRGSAHDRASILTKFALQPISSAAVEQFARQLQDSKGDYLTVSDSSTVAITSRSIYDANANKVYIAGHLSESQRAWELTKRLAEAVTHASSTAPEAIKSAEWRIVALQLATKWELRADLSFATETAQAFNTAQWGTTSTLEASIAKISRVTSFVSKGIGDAEQSLSMASEQAQEQQLAAQHTQAPVRTDDAQANFLEGI